MLPAIVLAAGESRRMGSPKALLMTPEGRPFAASVVRAFAAAGITNIVIVTGRDHDAVVEAVRADTPPVLPRFARNPDPARGQLSSLWTGMDAGVDAWSDALLMTLVDVPRIEPATIAAVVERWRSTRAPIVRPAIGERHGHPVIFDRAVFEELRSAPLDAGAKVVVRRHEHEVVNVAVDDEGCLVDVDTPEDYRAFYDR